MFIDEVKSKLKIDVDSVAFTVTLIGRSEAALSGIKSVLTASPEEVKTRLKNGTVSVTGENLVITEIGGGDVLIKGSINGVSFE